MSCVAGMLNHRGPRLTIDDVLSHPWMKSDDKRRDQALTGTRDRLRKMLARRRLKKAIATVKATNRFGRIIAGMRTGKVDGATTTLGPAAALEAAASSSSSSLKDEGEEGGEEGGVAGGEGGGVAGVEGVDGDAAGVGTGAGTGAVTAGIEMGNVGNVGNVGHVRIGSNVSVQSTRSSTRDSSTRNSSPVSSRIRFRAK